MSPLNIRQNEPLAKHSTMRLGGTAAYAVEVHDRRELRDAVAWADEHQLPAIMVGQGSNIVWRDEGFNGLLIINNILRFEVFDQDPPEMYVTIGSGEVWDSVVERCVTIGATGIECLSLIPGTAGATPVQNVGAYGQEIANTLLSVEAYDRQAKQFVSLPKQECGFGYRTSRFKTTDRGRFFITAITLHLTRGNPQPPFYKSLQQYLDEHGVTEYTPQTVRQAVMAIRRVRLPDPAMVANNGSFFANPIVSQGILVQIQAAHPDVPHWDAGNDMVKISAAWLVEQAGFKGVQDPATGMATWPSQALVLVNQHAKSTAQLLQFKEQIVAQVKQRFDITLVQEPELLP